MLKIKSAHSVPPGGYRYLVETTGYTVTAHDMNALLNKIESHLSVNEIEMKLPEGITLQQVVEDQMCRNLPSSFCSDTDQKKYVRFSQTPVVRVDLVGKRLGNDVLNRTIALIHLAKKDGYRFVKQELAEQRALRTLTCPYMRRARVCYACHHEGPVRQCIGEKLKTSLDSKMQVCGKLGVYLQAAVHIDARTLASLFTETDKEQLSSDYWLYPEL